MNALWSYFWPAFVAGTASGLIGGIIGFRRRPRLAWALSIGALASLALALLWHGPLGGAARFSAHVERGLQKTLVYYEMTMVSAHLQHAPLTRTVVLSGPADDFQREELVRLIEEIPGVASATWSSDSGGNFPLFVEGCAVSLLGFLLGLLLAYLIELRRRYNAQWNW